jgi:hypothetical protein
MAHRNAPVRSIMVRVRTSRKATEVLRLEIRRLASRLGLPPTAVRIRRVDDGRR